MHPPPGASPRARGRENGTRWLPIAEAALHLARVRAAGNEAQADCVRLIDRAEKLVGEQLIAAKEAGELAKRGGDRSKVEAADFATLDDIGVTKDQSADWQQRAKVADAVVDNAMKGSVALSGAP